MPHLKSFAKKSARGVAAATLLIYSSGVSFAIEASAVVERFMEFNKSQGQQFSYGSIENDNGDSFTLKGVSVTFPGVMPVSAANIQFNSVAENADGSVSIGSVVYEKINFSNEEVVVTLNEAAIRNFTLPSKTNPDVLRSLIYFSELTGTGLNIVANGKPVVSMSGLKVSYGEIMPDKPIAMNGEINGINLDLTGVGDPQFEAVLSQLGYDGKFTGKMMLQGTWNPVDGRMDLSRYDIQVDKIGTLSMLIAIGGYTADLAKRLQKVGQMASDSETAQMAGMALMQELPNLVFESAKISFTDDSITRRLLKFQGEQMGGTADDMAKMAPTMIPLVMGGLGNPAFTSMVAGAVGKFLSEPGNIAISAKPEKPVPFSELMGIGMAAPQTLPNALGVKVTANE